MFGSRNRNKLKLERELMSTIEPLSISSSYGSRICTEAFEELEPDISDYDDIQLALELTGFMTAHSSILFLNDKDLMKDYIGQLTIKMILKHQKNHRTEYIKELTNKAVVLLEEGRSKTNPESSEPYIYMGTGLISLVCRSSLDNSQIRRVNTLVETYLDRLGLDKLVIAVDNLNSA